MLARPAYLERLRAALRRSPVTALFGPRQCGKTTLARMVAEGINATRFDLESQPDLRRLQNPESVLGKLSGLVVIDEIQVLPSLFSVLRVLADRPASKARFLMLGSASPDIVRGVSESLAGRVEFDEAPLVTRSMRIALQDLQLEHIWVLCPAPVGYPVDDRITIWPLREIAAFGEQFTRRQRRRQVGRVNRPLGRKVAEYD